MIRKANNIETYNNVYIKTSIVSFCYYWDTTLGLNEISLFLQKYIRNGI